MSMNLDLATFQDNLFSLSHLKNFCNSATIASCISVTFCPKQSSVELRVVLSEYKIKANFVLAFTMSLIKMLNKRDPIIDP